MFVQQSPKLGVLSPEANQLVIAHLDVTPPMV
jgi:hypothetical protein